MLSTNNFTLWENKTYIISTPLNPHQPYSEGVHVVVASKADIANAWQDPKLTGEMFKLAAKACKIMEAMGLGPWFNLQANGNWGLLPGGTPFFHIHIYGRNKTLSWGKPLILPEAPKTYQNDPMPETDRTSLSEALITNLTVDMP
jgi:diadenosine tetraphosphate (Ap4A) HIT family hydrolase